MPSQKNAVIIEPETAASASVIWLHGLGADGHDFEPIVPELHIPADAGVRFIFPHAPVRAVTLNAGMQMRAWYDVRHMDLRMQEDTDSIIDSAAIASKFIDTEVASGIPAGKIILAGFSQGGAIALHAGLRYPEKLAGLLVLSAYLPLPERLASEGSDANRTVPVMMAHGIYDPVIPVDAGKQSCELLQEHGYPATWITYPMQHAVCLEEIRDIADWLKSCLV